MIKNLKEFKPETPTSGIMNLIWARDEKDIYKYSYQLFELKKDANETSGIVKEIILGESSTYVIDTQEDSLGVYWFVINILSPNGTLLGNKIYAFEVAGNNNNLYYVKQNGLAISANSMFKKNDIVDYNFKFGSSTGTDDNTIKTKIPNTSLALYISNSDLEVVKTEDVTLSKWVDETDSVTIYEVDAITYKVYFGILKVSATSQLIGNAKIVKNEMTDVEFGKNEFSTLVDKTNPTLNLTATRGISSTKMFEKNLLLLDIFYNDQKVKTVEYSGNINFAILGNGEYKFQVRDLAGNIHKFECAEEEVRVLILREVAVTINDEAPIENAYYNGEVSLKVYAATKYVTGSIEVKAERNGSEYQLSNSNPYIFKDYGTYVVKITGKFKSSDMELEQELTKTLTFSIINPDEVRTAIDLTNLKQHTITRVLNNKGNDITNEFLDMINNKTNAMLIRHEDVMERAIALKVSAGKLKFTIDYLVNDGIYPNREIQLQFTLNNEEPVIDCSLEIGETTKKEFSISFNPGIIFGQIGDCDICTTLSTFSNPFISLCLPGFNFEP